MFFHEFSIFISIFEVSEEDRIPEKTPFEAYADCEEDRPATNIETDNEGILFPC